ncbi:MAG: trypsin-like peptidase domain-containing protein [Clostridia bacterium]|nr:trypsin-like peptidase domain-containing protein [Clostridia bacterium]
MKHNRNENNSRRGMTTLLSLMLTGAVLLTGGAALNSASVLAEASTTAQAAIVEPVADTSPAIAVAQKNANSVVGIITSAQTWSRSSGVSNQPVAQGSGVVIAAGGYILTNYHVVEDGDAYQVLLPSGEKVDAKIVGTDSATDLAVLQVQDADDAKQLIPVEVGASDGLQVGSTVIAIGNPGGEVLANTVTMGIISALERTSVTSDNTSRRISYIQHDAAINSGNSGGGLFNSQGQLIGINTLKYSGSAFSGASYEGLGFAIPVDIVSRIADELIENGVVTRPGLGITVVDTEGPDEPLTSTPPESVMIYGINAGSAADQAGLQRYDYITEVDGVRIKSYLDLTEILDQHEPGDTVSVTVVRYNRVQVQQNQNNGNGRYGYGYGFGYGFGYGGRNGGYNAPDGDSENDADDNTETEPQTQIGSGYEIITVDVTLQALESGK